MVRMLVVDPKKRASIKDLLKTEFIRMSQGFFSEELGDTPLEDTNLTDQRCNMYKFNMAHCFDEITCRYRLNQNKRKIVRGLKVTLFDAKSMVAGAADANNQNTPMPAQGNQGEYKVAISIEEF